MPEPLVMKYGPHDRQVIGVYGDDLQSHRFVFFIHGGAWRDPRNTFRDGDTVLSAISGNSKSAGHNSVVGISIDYRLSPEVIHPTHIEDVALALEFVNHNYKVEKAIIVGHSVGATIALQLFQQRERWSDAPKNVLSKVNSIVGSQGIYDIRALLRDDASYEGFIREALGKTSTYEYWDIVSPLSEANKHVPKLNFNGRLIVAHSPDDELLNIEIQPEIAQRLLRPTPIEVVMNHNVRGHHDDVYQSQELVDIVKEECSLWSD
jgi:kynurenine formamidase